MIVYRYLNLTYGLESLQSRRWKIGRMSELNDPFDCRPQMINLPPGAPGGPKFSQLYINQLMGQFGVLCYSGVINDPVIWSHYAEAHKGLALGFDFENTAGRPLVVSYKTAPPVFDFRVIEQATTQSEMESAVRLFQMGFTTKAPSWEYENEYRQFIDLDACDMLGIHYFRTIPTEYLKEVVLGACCPVTMKDVARILHPYTNYPHSIEVRQCRMNESSFELGFDSLPHPPGKK